MISLNTCLNNTLFVTDTLFRILQPKDKYELNIKSKTGVEVKGTL